MWGAGLAEYQHRVLRDLRMLIPGGRPRLLDAGCGDGALTDRFLDIAEVTGLDRSHAALGHMQANAVVGSIESLPFDDGSFAVAMSNDTVEHLPDGVFERSLRELGRVASDRVLVTVPYREVLGAANTLCAACGRSFHINHHQRSFDCGLLTHLLDEPWSCSALVYSGLKVTALERAQQRLRAEFGWHIRWELAMCPHCGASKSISGESLGDQALINELAESYAELAAREEPGRNECIALYERDPRHVPDGPTLLRISGGAFEPIQTTLDEDAEGIVLRPASADPAQTSPALCWGIDGVAHVLTDPEPAGDGGFRVPGWFRPEILRAGERPHTTDSPGAAALLTAARERRRLYNEIQRAEAEAAVRARDVGAANAQLEILRTQAQADRDEAKASRQDAEAARRGAEAERLKHAEELREQQRQLESALERSAASEAEASRLADELAHAREQIAALSATPARRPGLLSWAVRVPMRIGRGPSQSRAEFIGSVRAQAAPTVVDQDWDRAAAAGRSFIMLCHDQRIDRRIVHQARALLDAGWTGKIIAMSFDGDDHLDEEASIPVHRIGLDRLVPDCPVYWAYRNRTRWIMRLNVGTGKLGRANQKLYHLMLRRRYRGVSVAHPMPFDLAYEAAGDRYPADLIVGHDLPAVRAAVRLGEKHGSKVIYDAHELYPEQRGFSAIQKRMLDKAERDWAPKCDRVITVSRSFGDFIQKKSGVERTDVIRNVTNRHEASPTRGRVFHDKLGLPGAAKIVLFQGSIVGDQNLHTLVEGFVKLARPDTHLVFLGPRNEDVATDLKARAGSMLDKTVHFMDPVGQDVLLKHTESAHFGVIPYLPYDLNCRYCMPNKLFEYIQAGLPVLASDLKEIRGVLEDAGGGGTLGDLETPVGVADALAAMFERDLDQDRAILLEAAKRLCWEVEQERYLDIVSEVMDTEARV